MTAIIDIVDLVHPSVSGMNVIVSDQVWILFDRELDTDSLQENIFITGPDQDTWSGPDLLLFNRNLNESNQDSILQSPNFRGYVEGTFTFEKVNLLDLDSYSGYDYGGDGTLWRTRAVFTPTKQLTPNTEYKVYVTGDESATDELDTGVKTRTIFDTTKGANLGTGEATYVGSYIGEGLTDTFHVRITTAGAANTAKFIWYRGSAPLLTFGPFTAFRGTVDLDDGISIKFTTGSFSVSDSFSVAVKQATVFTGNLIWPFTTGTGSIQELPSSVSTDISGTPSSTSSLSTFSVLSTSPASTATDLDTPFEGDMSIVLTMNDTVDGSTVDTDSVSVNIESVIGEDDSGVSSIVAEGLVLPTISVSGSEITLTIASGIIQENNIITVILGDTIASDEGISLSSEYEFSFTSRYYPLYSSWRRVMLDYGAFLGNIAKDTVNLAIYEASMTSDSLSWSTNASIQYLSGVAGASSVEDYYLWVRREFTTCKAAEALLLNAIGLGQGLKSKKLGDFEVSYDTDRLQEGLEKALGCLGKWEATLHGRGMSKRKPQYAIKGNYDPSSPPTGRGWDITSKGSLPVATAKKLTGRRWNSGYYNSSRGRTGKGNS